MGLTLEITPDLEPLLRAEAEKQGSDPLVVAERMLRTKLIFTRALPPFVGMKRNQLKKRQIQKARS